MVGPPEVIAIPPPLISNEALIIIAVISALLIISTLYCAPDFASIWISTCLVIAIIVVAILRYGFPSVYPDVVDHVFTLLLYTIGMAYVGLSAVLLVGLPQGQVTDAHRKGENRPEEKDENANSERKDRDPFVELHSVMNTKD